MSGCNTYSICFWDYADCIIRAEHFYELTAQHAVTEMLKRKIPDAAVRWTCHALTAPRGRTAYSCITDDPIVLEGLVK